MFSLQKTMSRGSYALWAAVHMLLLCVLLKLVAWGESQYLPPVSMLATFVGVGVCGSLTVCTIRRMRDAGIRSFVLLCPFVWGIALALICITMYAVAAATPISAVLSRPYNAAELALLYIAGILFVPLAVAMLSAPSQKTQREPGGPAARFHRHMANGLARTFCFGGRATRSEFWCFALPAFAAAAGGAYLMQDLLPGGHSYSPFHLIAAPATAAIAALAAALLLPLLSISIRRVRDAGQLLPWGICALAYFACLAAASTLVLMELVSRSRDTLLFISGTAGFCFSLYTLVLLLKPTKPQARA